MLNSHNSRPILKILPSLEVLISCRLGDDYFELVKFWECLVREVIGRTPYVFDNTHVEGDPCRANQRHYSEIKSAFRQSCKGVDRENLIDWTNIAFHDTQGVNDLPTYSCSCLIGRIINPEDPRGFSLRITVPKEKINELEDLGRNLANGWPDIWRWISIGYRFVSVPMFSDFIADSINVIRGQCRRFKGVDVGDLFGVMTSYWQNKIRSVNWITIVSSNLFSFGNVFHFAGKDTTNQISIEKVNGGMLLRTGVNPSLCDINKNESCDDYAKVYQIIESVCVNDDPITFPPFFDQEESHEWLHRFKL